jgi:hypothetical protein
MPTDSFTIAAAQVAYMRRNGFTPDECAQAIGWYVPPGLIGWDDIAEAFGHVASEMRETLVKRALSECPKTATGGVLETPRPADPDGSGLVKAGHGRLKTLERFKDRGSAFEIQACRNRHARFRLRLIPSAMPRPTEWGVH